MTDSRYSTGFALQTETINKNDRSYFRKTVAGNPQTETVRDRSIYLAERVLELIRAPIPSWEAI
jgi:hypothetical protein